MKNTVPDLILMQWTGLLDKNGKDIYEGDIVSRGEQKVEVEMHTFCGWPEYNPKYMEIIGNIYENPELVKKQEVRE